MRTRPRGSRIKTFLAVIFSVMLTFTMMPALPFMTRDAHAQSNPDNLIFDVSEGNVTIGLDANSTKNNISFGNSQTKTIDPTDTITLTGTTTTNSISITTKNNVNIILKDLNIDVSGTKTACAFSKTGTGALTLSLAGTTVLRSGSDHAGLEKNGDTSGTLTIQDFDGDSEVGSLEATSGTSSDNGKTYLGNGAGIGGGYKSSGDGYSGENITINSGSVTAKSHNGAGIGGGLGHTTGGAGGTVTISGGSVTAISSGFGAGIGGGLGGSAGGDGGIVTISGGSVTAKSGVGGGVGGNGAGIGGGATAFEGSDPGGDGGTVTISGGSVTAASRNGAGIGGGANFNVDKGGAGGTVTISGGTVTATSSRGAGIGGAVEASNNGTLSSGGTNGNAWIVTSSYNASITDTGKVFESGVVFDGTEGKAYGAPSLPGDEEIPSGSTLTIDTGNKLTVPSGVTLTNNGTLTCNGTLENYGTIDNKADLKIITPISHSNSVFTSTGKVTLGWSGLTGSVTFDPDGGTLDVFALLGTLIPNNNLTAPTKSGYTCTGWKDGANNSYGPTGTFTPTDGMVLTAQWTQDTVPTPSPTTYSVTLNGDGGTGSALTSYTEGTVWPFPADWTKEGYTFSGWYDNSDFAGSAVTAISSTDTGAKTFYAKWTKNGDGATSAPKTPVKVKAKAAGTHSIKITWDKAKGASYYKIYKVTKKSGASAKPNSYKYIGRTTGTSFTAKSLKAGTTYSFKVKAVNSAGNSKLSKIVTAKTKKTSGAVNGSVGFTLKNISGNNVKVHWSKVSGAAKYQVASCRAGAKMKTKWTGKNSLCTYTSTNLTKGKTYKYKMRYCKVKSGKNVWSKWSAVKTIKVK